MAPIFIINNVVNDSINNSLPLFLSTSWQIFFNHIFQENTETLWTNLTFLSQLFNYNNKFLVNSNLTGYVLAILFALIFSFMYIKPSSKGSYYYLSNISELVWYVSFTYFFLVIFANTDSKLNNIFWLNNYFDINNNFNNKITVSILLIIVLIFSSFITTLKKDYNKISPETLILVYLVGCFGWSLLEINDYALFVVCLEGFSLTLYILAATSRVYGGISASIKYFIFGTLGSILLYWGGLILFEVSASMNINFISYLIENKYEFLSFLYPDETYLKIVASSNLILLGLLIKLGAAPFHQWIPDVYAGVSLFVTAFYSICVKIILFMIFLKFAISFISVKEIEYAAILSLIVGCFGTLRQVEIKRFLAYSSITHTGYLLIGDLSSTYIYLITYVVASLFLFSILINIQLNNKELIYLSDLRFVGQVISQTDRFFLVLILASMAGLPPFAGFYGKMLVWMSLFEDIYLYNDLWSFLLLFINLLLALIIMFYYMQVLCILFINDEISNNLTYFSVINFKSELNKIQFIEFLNSKKQLKVLQAFGSIFLIFGIFILPYLYYIF